MNQRKDLKLTEEEEKVVNCTKTGDEKFSTRKFMALVGKLMTDNHIRCPLGKLMTDNHIRCPVCLHSCVRPGRDESNLGFER